MLGCTCVSFGLIAPAFDDELHEPLGVVGIAQHCALKKSVNN
jgi:hypothetical protein